MTKADTFALAPGFTATATACGLKPNGALDMALIAADAPCSAAGLFTTNRVKAAPVIYDQHVLATNAGSIRAVVINAGNANACTGPQGAGNCRAMAEMTAERLGCRADQVLVLSTGVIGRQLDMAKVARGIAALTGPTAHQGAGAAARAIMTTDTRPKVAARTISVAGKTVTIAGMCKGAGMIHPNMATMLAVVTTDAQASPAILDRALRYAADRSFNRVSVDGDTSTNDTLLLLASGASGVQASDTAEPDGLSFDQFTAMLAEVCIDLAKQIARDGEGATRLVEITVSGAQDEQQAHQVANAIARSPLVKTAIHGGDPNWGRIVCAAGYSGAAIDPDRLALWFGPASSPIQLVANGLPLDADLAAASALLRQDPVFITLDLGLGSAHTTVWTCDFSKEYVEINAHYTT
ncbi:MAG: bifunctional glutamate N-acetyltransferase/amino-acid acetyltransferase ArgJ [Roseiflexaceae bacterium]|nr:bifunctional glutamate N-acetyltransferase/amino-acid acetyltransferase ArgJ [Roseiflexaceae bacterium]